MNQPTSPKPPTHQPTAVQRQLGNQPPKVGDQPICQLTRRPKGSKQLEESGYNVAQLSSCDVNQDVIFTAMALHPFGVHVSCSPFSDAEHSAAQFHDWFRLADDRYIGECMTTFEDLCADLNRLLRAPFPFGRKHPCVACTFERSRGPEVFQKPAWPYKLSRGPLWHPA